MTYLGFLNLGCELSTAHFPTYTLLLLCVTNIFESKTYHGFVGKILDLIKRKYPPSPLPLLHFKSKLILKHKIQDCLMPKISDLSLIIECFYVCFMLWEVRTKVTLSILLTLCRHTLLNYPFC